jgi:hypothetical protein
MLNRIFSILGAQWLIHQDTAVSYLPVLIVFVKGQDMLLKPADDKKPYVVAWADIAQLIPTIGKWNLTDVSMPENSVAVIPVDGVICSWNSVDLMTMLRDAQDNDSINSILLVVNFPGGMVSQIDLLAGSIKSLTKPTVSVVMGMAASAAMWVISATSYRIATSPIYVIRSNGTKTSIQDYSGLLEKIGIKTMFYFHSGEEVLTTIFSNLWSDISLNTATVNNQMTAWKGISPRLFFAKKDNWANHASMMGVHETPDHSLFYRWETGIYNRFWKEFLTLLVNAKTVKFQKRMDFLEFRNFDFSRKYMIGGGNTWLRASR